MKAVTPTCVLLMLLALGCSGLTANSAAVPSTGPAEPNDPLADAARSLSVSKARVERSRSQPAGPNGEQAEYEWTILARVSLADVAVPSSLVVNGQKPSEVGWTIVRLTLRAHFEKRYDNQSRGPQGEWLPQPGRRHLALEVQCPSVTYLPGLLAGKSTRNGLIRPGAGLTLNRNTWPGPTLDGPFAPLTTYQVLLEVNRAPLDDLVQPLFQGPETVDLPKTLELLRIAEQTTKLEIVR